MEKCYPVTVEVVSSTLIGIAKRTPVKTDATGREAAPDTTYGPAGGFKAAPAKFSGGNSVDTMEEWCKRLKMPLTEDQKIAGKYLESRHSTFLIDFGYGNAVAKADALFDLECEKAMEEGLIQ